MSVSAAEHESVPTLERMREEQGQNRMLAHAFAQLDPVALGAAVGVVSAALVWIATAVLLLRGGENVGYHLSGLAYYLVGYSVSWSGACIGAFDAAVMGFAVGGLLAHGWNAYHRWFVALAHARDVRRELQGL